MMPQADLEKEHFCMLMDLLVPFGANFTYVIQLTPSCNTGLKMQASTEQ